MTKQCSMLCDLFNISLDSLLFMLGVVFRREVTEIQADLLTDGLKQLQLNNPRTDGSTLGQQILLTNVVTSSLQSHKLS